MSVPSFLWCEKGEVFLPRPQFRPKEEDGDWILVLLDELNTEITE